MKRFLITILLSMLGCAVTLASTLPDLGEVSGETLTAKQEQEMGFEFMRVVHHSSTILQDAVIKDYVQNLGAALASHSHRQAKDFHFFVLADSDVNAFSGPNAYVGINSGLILKTKTESELAAVLAHEIAHVSQRHIAQMIGRAQSLQVTSIGGLLAAIALGTANPMAGVGMAAASMAGNYQQLINFTRAHEAEADRVGMEILVAAGYDPRAMPAFFERLAQEHRMNEVYELPPLLQTHPVTEARLADAYNRCSQYSIPKSIAPAPFKLLQTRLAVLLAPNPFEMSQQYKNQVSQKLDVSNHLDTYYGYVLALLRVKQWKEAERVLDQLKQADPSNILFDMAQAELQEGQRNHQQARATFAKLHQQYQHHYGILMGYTQLLKNEGRYREIYQLLKPDQLQYRSDENYLLLLSEAEGKIGRFIDAYQDRAAFYQLQGDKTLAKQQLQMALKNTQDPLLQQKIRTAMQQL